LKKNRSTLKDYFKKGAIPTEANFADLIDSMLNQEEDNISKLPSDPLKITAIGVDEALVNFYRIEKNAEQLSWQIKQKPDGKAGLNISDTAASRLFIENGSGSVGIGTTTPKQTLDVRGKINVEDGVIQRGGDPITGTKDLGLYSLGEGYWIRMVTKNAPINFFTDGGIGTNAELSISKAAVSISGKLGIGNGATAAIAKLDIFNDARSGTHPTAVKGLYVTGNFAPDSDGVEFRHSNGSQGIGFGYNTIYATGSLVNQDLYLKPRGAGKIIVTGALQVSGALQVTGAQIQLDGGQKIAFADADTSNNLKLQLWSGYGLGINNGTLFYAANGNHSWRDASGTNERMLLTTGAEGALTVKGTGISSFAGGLRVDGNITTKKSLLMMGTTVDGTTAKNGELVGGIGFLGYGVQHGMLGFRAGKGFELVDRSESGPSLDYDYDSRTYADLKIRNLSTTGNINVAGSQNIFKVKTFTLAIKNAGVNKPNDWTVDYSDQKFTEVYTVFACLQGYSVWPNDTNFGNWGHVKSLDAITQHTFVRVTSSDTKTAKGTAYCSESNADSEVDNTVLFTVIVMGRI
jgi:hypothetical protein